MKGLTQKIKELIKRINGFSTPLFGLSWTSRESAQAPVQSLNGLHILTVEECARVLRVDVEMVITLLESGELIGLSIDGKWQVTSEQLVAFLHERTKSKQLEVFVSQLSDPKVWAKELEKNSVLKKEIEEGNYPENSFGRFLQEGLISVRNKQS